MGENSDTEDSTSNNQTNKPSDNDFSNTVVKHNNNHKLNVIDLNFERSIYLCVVMRKIKLICSAKGAG